MGEVAGLHRDQSPAKSTKPLLIRFFVDIQYIIYCTLCQVVFLIYSGKLRKRGGARAPPPVRRKVSNNMSFSANGRKRPGENSCFPPSPFSALLALCGAPRRVTRLRREWWGSAPHPASFCAKRKRKSSYDSRGKVTLYSAALILRIPDQYIPPMPPAGIAGAAAASSGLSATRDSVVRTIAATDAAF